MSAQPVGPWRLIYIHIFYAVYTNWIITFLERMSANSDAQFGIINQQQHLAFNHHPWHLAPLPLHHHHPQQPLPLTAHCCHQPPTTTADNQQQNNQQQCGNAMSQATTTTSTTRDDEWHLEMNTNDPTTHKRQPAPTNGHKWQQAKVRQPTSPPSNPLIWNPGATSPSAMWQLNDKQQPRFVVCHCC